MNAEKSVERREGGKEGRREEGFTFRGSWVEEVEWEEKGAVKTAVRRSGGRRFEFQHLPLNNLHRIN